MRTGRVRGEGLATLLLGGAGLTAWWATRAVTQEGQPPRAAGRPTAVRPSIGGGHTGDNRGGGREGREGHVDAGVLGALLARIRGSDRNDRLDALEVLLAMGEEALPALRLALRDSEGRPRPNIAGAICSMNAGDVEAFSALEEAANDSSASVREQAARAIDAYDARSLAILDRALSDSDVSVRASAAARSMELGPYYQPSPSMRLDMVASPSAYPRTAGLWLLRSHQSVARTALPAIEEALLDPEPYVREAAFGLLNTSLSDVRPLEGTLRRILEGPDPKMRASALGALLRFGASGEELTKVATGLLSVDDDEVRGIALHVLRAFETKPAAPPLPIDHAVAQTKAVQPSSPDPQLSLDDPDPAVRLSAAIALAKRGAEGRAGLPELVEGVLDPAYEVRRRAVYDRLAELGPAARLATPALVLALEDRQPGTRRLWFAAASSMN